MLIAVIRTYGIGALGERPPAQRVWRSAPVTATTIAFFPTDLASW
jgi:hypothetical protein